MMLQVVQKDSVESGTVRPKSLQFLSLSLLLIHSFFKCEVVPEQKNPEKEGKAKSLHDNLPCGKAILRRVSQRVTFRPSFTCLLVPNFVSCFQDI